MFTQEDALGKADFTQDYIEPSVVSGYSNFHASAVGCQRVTPDLGHNGPDIDKQVSHVQGNLKKSYTYWQDTVNAPQTVLDTIISGYILALKEEPPPKVFENHGISLPVCGRKHTGTF